MKVEDIIPKKIVGETPAERADKLMTIYADAQSRKSVEDTVMKTAGEELEQIFNKNPKLRDSDGRLMLGDGYVYNGITRSTEAADGIDIGKVEAVDPVLVKKSLNMTVLKSYMADGDNVLRRNKLEAAGVKLLITETKKVTLKVTRKASAALAN
jgi:hypothetical protein